MKKGKKELKQILHTSKHKNTRGECMCVFDFMCVWAVTIFCLIFGYQHQSSATAAAAAAATSTNNNNLLLLITSHVSENLHKYSTWKKRVAY